MILLRFACCAALVLVGVSSAVAQNPTAPTINIHFDKPLHSVSPNLYGLMTEEINYSYDGGLYGELVQNRTLQNAGFGGPLVWYLVAKGDAVASINVDRTTAPGDAIHQSLRIDVKQASPSGQAGVQNEGYWGMPAMPNTEYKGSFYAKTDTAELGPVTASLVENNSGAVLATAQVTGVGSEWNQYSYKFKTGDIKATKESHLELTVGHAGKLWLDLVSLFPPTYHDRPNGNRIDLMEMLGAMKPAFLRFPGGNYLEGDEPYQRFEFKTTIGPLIDRPTHPSPWGYQSSDGMGLLEFLEWCEDLKMDPLLAVYAGYSLRGTHINPGPSLRPFVEDALDEIEYVTGDVHTKWGAERAKDGHPAPFKLHYVEIGNEDWFDKSGSYPLRYAQFYKAIKEKYPQLELIATTPVKNMKPDLVDDHFYERADEMMAIVNQYDKADRNGPKIFVGEWATREGTPTTNFGAALGDAAWMTGLERNSDLVVMAAYAPLLVNVGPRGMQWDSNLIGYDALTSYGSPSYWAQVMFAQHLGTAVPESAGTGLPERYFYSATEDKAKKQLILKVVNGSSVARSVQVKIDGASGGEERVSTLAAPDTTTANTIDHPRTVVPVESGPVPVDASFVDVAPPYSIRVITIDLK